ncbi:capsular exopolysaccharide synthesis family protein [Psychrobacillus insolitus]|uniref:non-specific protein-tyrosine kinase n=1 Tax=Psychrobacillus insolitus TaxID=1461 RepID=A0A2W7MIG7_9BACI|nr:CpsD/CapB family tyrosine-protein kinase [Psychrobacillus insolitus]PZX05931.1 capsular exopolysaccharide synthesis family protein [Psychrobacillus insolitus]
MAKKTKNLKEIARKLIVKTSPKSFVSEQFRGARTNINFSMPDGELKTLLVTSSLPGEGKSTTSANLAYLFAQEGKRVILIDGDMRKPTVHYTFHLTNTIGLSNVLTKKVSVMDALNETDLENLQIITSGPIPPNPAELLTASSMDDMITTLKETYDLIIFDAPPVLSVTDSQILANKSDGTVLVISAGDTDKVSALKAKELLLASKAKIIGTVLNNFKLEKDHHYYQYYGTGE